MRQRIELFRLMMGGEGSGCFSREDGTRTNKSYLSLLTLHLEREGANSSQTA